MPIQAPGSPSGPKFPTTTPAAPAEPQRPLIGTRSVGPTIESKPKDTLDNRRQAPVRMGPEPSGSAPAPRAPDAANRRSQVRSDDSPVYNSATRALMAKLLALPEAAQARLSGSIEAFA